MSRHSLKEQVLLAILPLTLVGLGLYLGDFAEWPSGPVLLPDWLGAAIAAGLVWAGLALGLFLLLDPSAARRWLAPILWANPLVVGGALALASYMQGAMLDARFAAQGVRVPAAKLHDKKESERYWRESPDPKWHTRTTRWVVYRYSFQDQPYCFLKGHVPGAERRVDCSAWSEEPKEAEPYAPIRLLPGAPTVHLAGDARWSRPGTLLAGTLLLLAGLAARPAWARLRHWVGGTRR